MGLWLWAGLGGLPLGLWKGECNLQLSRREKKDLAGAHRRRLHLGPAEGRPAAELSEPPRAPRLGQQKRDPSSAPVSMSRSDPRGGPDFLFHSFPAPLADDAQKEEAGEPQAAAGRGVPGPWPSAPPPLAHPPDALSLLR